MNPFDRDDIFYLLHLISVPGVGSQRIRNLIARFKSPDAVFRASPREIMEIEGIDRTLARNIKRHNDTSFAEEQLKKLNHSDARIVTFWDAEYPQPLKRIFDPPVLLFVRGSMLPSDTQSIAVVGTRSPSSYGSMMAERFTRDLVQHGLTIVSGLARGIDTISHRSTLAAGGRTIAVLGTGVDLIYPPENKKLAERISKSGAVISEFPMGTKPDAPHFPRRNRIIAGMSLGTLIVEAGLNSGAIITANFAVDQGREVFAIPGNINNPKSSGCHHLIQQGAKLVQKVSDVIEELQIGLVTQKIEAHVELSKNEERLFELLSYEPLHIDLIAKKAKMTTAQALGILLSLELKNLVRQIAGKNFVRV